MKSDGPSEPVCKHGGLALSSTVAVKEGWEFRLDCSSDGNPSPSFSWTHPGDGPSYPLFIRSINRTHAGIFRIQARNSLIPSNQQAVNLTKDINITVDVQYPPDPPNCSVGSTAISDLVSAIRGNTITISCSCDSNPPSRYSWSVTGVSTPTSGQSFDLLVQNATTITFTIVNSMQFTNRSTEQGRRESSFDVKVLYPPSTPSFHFGGRFGKIIPDNTLTVIRGKVTTVICESSAKPPPTYTWNGNNNTLTFTPTVDENKECCVRNIAPTFPTFHFGGRTGANISGNSLSVIRGNITTITCKSTANPMPVYTWNGNNRTWTFTPTDDENRTCTVRNSMVTTGNKAVPDPPSTPSFHFGGRAGEIIPDNTLTVIRGKVTTVICESSANPPPTYTWNGNNNTLTFTPTVDENKECCVRNSMVTTGYGTVSGYNSSVLKVNVLFAPTIPTFHFGGRTGANIRGNSLSVIRGNITTVTCESTANPIPVYTWNGNNRTWTFTPTDDEKRTCTVRNSMVTTRNETVFDPPSTPSFHFGGRFGKIIPDNTLTVIRGKVTTVICESSAKPPPTYTWNGNNNTLTFTPTVDENKECCVRNSMVTTGYGTVSGYNSSVLKVNVLFAPTFPTFHFGGRTGANISGNSLSVIRGNITTITCKSTANPMPVYTWNGNNRTWTFTPTDDENRTCTVRNSMVTTGNKAVPDPPSTPSFHFGGRAGEIIPDNTLTVIRGKVITVICESSANPPPTYTWNGNNNTLTFTPTVDENKECCVRNSMVTTGYGTVSGYNSSVLKVNVLFAPTIPTFHFGGRTGANIRGNSLSVIRGNITTVTCESTANPIPVYTWNGNNRTWTFTPTDDEQRTCTVRNSMVTTRNETVFDPPSTPSFHFGGRAGAIIPDNTLNVIRGKVTTVICESSANPPPSYTWNGNNRRLKFKPTVDENKTCIVRNIMVTTEYGTVPGYNSSVLKVNVLSRSFRRRLHPPGTPDLSFPSCLGEPITVNTSIKVIQGQPVNVTCSASSRPAPTYSWSRHQSKQSNVMWIPNAQTSHQGTYTCKAENIMDITFGGPIGTNSSKHFHLEVLMPPMVNPLTNVVVLERGNVSVVCQVTDGVPNKTEFKWEKMSDMTPISMEQTLSIDNIDRKQGGNYTCTASNLMRPTGCNATVGNSSNTVNIDVQYEAEVTNFTVSNFNHGQNIEVDENTQSNPLSNISMLKETQDLKTASHTNDLEFTISKSVCEDEGTYHCTTQNAHNTEADIRCSSCIVVGPKKPEHNKIYRSACSIHSKASSFPTATNRNTWVIVRNDTDIDILISEDGLQTQLSFSSVKEDDFGYYRVHVNNELGNYTESFRLQAQEHPHSPSSLQHFQKATVDTIHIEWTPGFDGGLPQTFYIEYREVGASVWREERGIAGQINYTIVGLNPATMYEIRVYSTNDIGRSNASEAITASTLKTPESGRPPVVLISVLVIVVCVVFAVVVIIVVIKKRLKGKTTADMDRLTMHHNLQSLGNPNTDGTDDDEDACIVSELICKPFLFSMY
ncbi:HMCN1-like protein [Mya arenaria]|uniref:HMCN1-like protein n=1 Tax=Mya arenaria TaxID=6604 RepID=A0ABY7E5P3_MYAAR|nr:HMCN1-like protein [Mya arenaria]